MISYAMIKESGCIDYAGKSKTPPSGYIILPDPMDLEFIEHIRFVDGLWEAKPEIPAWDRTPTGIQIQNCPEGMEFEIVDVETGAHLGNVFSQEGLFELSLPDPGSYRIAVSVPDPWAPYETFIVEVEN